MSAAKRHKEDISHKKAQKNTKKTQNNLSATFSLAQSYLVKGFARTKWLCAN
jgi:hypothetical protein